MICFLCGTEIGWLRSTVDRQYCCDEHRKEAGLATSTVLREEEHEQELWAVSRSREKQTKSAKPSATPTAPIFLFLAAGALLIVMFMGPGNGARPEGSGVSSVSLEPGANQGLVSRTGDFIGKLIQDQAPVTLHHDFASGLGDWSTVSLRTMASTTSVDDPHDWKRPSTPSLVMPGSLRLWSRSTLLRNYQMEFQGQLEKRSLSWAFRATDAKNYYAAKIVITKPGPLPNAGLVHYAMLNGHETDRVQLPLPLTLERGGNYRVRVSVKDDRFVTYLNGQVISSWKDSRLTRGGVGFFADNDDEQKVAWVNLFERDSFVGQMISQFSLFVMPGSVTEQ